MSFKLELPNELKQTEVHNIFHLSLLRIHISNDDRLFPGQQENQLRLRPEVEEEWAVEEVLSHHGSKGDIIFELKWKSGDITWLPSHDIAHLQVLKNYLDAQGMDQINQLPPGKRNALLSDPQITLGFINLGFDAEKSTIAKIYKYSSNHPSFSPPHLSATFTSLLTSSLPITTPTIMGKRQCSPQINHPRFSKQGRHQIQVRATTGTFFVHVYQLLKFIEYDTLLRTTPVGQAL